MCSRLVLLSAALLAADGLLASARVHTFPCSTTPACEHPNAFTPTTFSPDEKYIISWMEAPLLESHLNDTLGSLGLKHVGIGITQVTDPTKNWTIEYLAASGFLEVMFPHIVKENDTPVDLDWCDDGAICAYEGIDPDTWNTLIYPSAKIIQLGLASGDQLNRFSATWLADQMASPHPYVLWGVMNKVASTYMESYTCQIFAQEALDVLSKDFGAYFICDIAALQSTVSPMLLAAAPPTPVPITPDLLKFYSSLPDPLHSTPEQCIKEFDILLNFPQKYHHGESGYYQLQTLWPPGRLHKVPLQLSVCKSPAASGEPEQRP